jgi:hypothetical protein
MRGLFLLSNKLSSSIFNGNISSAGFAILVPQDFKSCGAELLVNKVLVSIDQLVPQNLNPAERWL